MGFFWIFLHLRKICKESPEKTINTLVHCFSDNGLPLSKEETMMLTNFLVVVMVVLAREPNWLMVKKMKF